MEYLSVKDLSAKFAMPLRTVYYNLAKNKTIRSKKQGKISLFHIADFAKICNITLQSLQGIAKNEREAQGNKDVATLQKSLQDLQSKHEAVKEQNSNLQKFNSNLQEQANTQFLAFKEEKQEKIALQEKYDTLQTSYLQKMEYYTKRYYLLMGIVLFLLLVLLVQYAPTLAPYLS